MKATPIGSPGAWQSSLVSPEVGARVEVQGSPTAAYNGPGEVTEVNDQKVWRPDTRASNKEDWPHGWYLASVFKAGVNITWRYIYDGKPTGDPKDYGKKAVTTPPKGQKEKQVFYASTLKVKGGYIPTILGTDDDEIVWQGDLNAPFVDDEENDKSGQSLAQEAAHKVLTESFEHLFEVTAKGHKK